MFKADLLHVLAVLVCFVAALFALYYFNRHCERRFQYKFFSVSAFGSLAFATVLFIAGVLLLARHSDAGRIFGWTFVFSGGGVVWWIWYRNFTRTNLLYGFAGTLFQVALFVSFASAGFFAGLLACAIVFIALSSIQPVYVVNKRD
jgi:hypothetical protein